jgi:pectate lyase
VLTTNRTPALTVTRSWFSGARIRTPNLFGPGTWTHLFNNLWTDVDGRGLAVSCGAAALAQGNVFRTTHNGSWAHAASRAQHRSGAQRASSGRHQHRAYRVSLTADPAAIPDEIQAQAGAGKLF